VITKNNGHTKFQPTFGPEPKTVTAIGEGGITCEGTSGTIQRRHQDDVKLAPSQTHSANTGQNRPDNIKRTRAGNSRKDNTEARRIAKCKQQTIKE